MEYAKDSRKKPRFEAIMATAADQYKTVGYADTEAEAVRMAARMAIEYNEKKQDDRYWTPDMERVYVREPGNNSGLNHYRGKLEDLLDYEDDEDEEDEDDED